MNTQTLSNTQTMTLEEIKQRLTELAQNPVYEEVSAEVSEIRKAFQSHIENRPSRVESNLAEVDIEDDLIEEIKLLVKVFRDKKEQIRQERADLEKNNLKEKQAILDELTKVISEEENISKAYQTFNELKDKWREIGNVPGDKHHDIQREFARLSELFYYNMNIYKELRENDLKKNTGSKTEIIEKLQALLQTNSVREIESNLRLLQREWDHTGAVLKEEWEEIKTNYWDTVKLVQDKIAELKLEKKKQQEENLVKKSELIEKIKAIIANERNNQKDWERDTEAVIAIQGEWKGIGYASKEDNERLWQEFRTCCDEFFTEKKEFYGELKSVFDDNKKLKLAIIEKADALKDSTNWKDDTLKIIALQKQWQKIGNAGRKSEHVLWTKFRGICDHFFNKKKEHFAAKDVAMDENLKKKEALIASLATLEITGTDEEKIVRLGELTTEFNSIGQVPIKQKDRIQKAFREAMDKLSAKLNLDPKQQEETVFKAKVEAMATQENAAYLLGKERQFIRDKINKLNEEVVKIENNLGFFANSKTADKMLKDYQDKIDHYKEEIAALKLKLRLIPKV